MIDLDRLISLIIITALTLIVFSLGFLTSHLTEAAAWRSTAIAQNDAITQCTHLTREVLRHSTDLEP